MVAWEIGMLGWLRRRNGLEASRRLVAEGAEHERGGRIQEACEAYQAAVDAAPGHVAARLNLGAALEALGRTDDAARAYEAALGVAPENAFVIFNLGRLAYTRGQAPRARELLVEALRCKPDFAEAEVVLASVHEALGDVDASQRCLESALRLRPGYAGALRNLGLLHARRGRSLHILGRLPEAATCLREALRLHPDAAEIHCYLGNLLFDMGLLADASAHLARATELQPTLADAHAGLGNVHAAEKMLDDAARCFRRALALDPGLVHAHVNLGNALAGQGHQAQAIECFDAALALDPENAEARWCRALSAIPVLRESAQEVPTARANFAAEIAALDRWFDESRARRGFHVVGLRQPFWLAYQDECNADLLRSYGRLCTRLMKAWPGRQAPAMPAARAAGRIRVGVVSQYFRQHSIWNAIVKGWFQHLDRGRFELSAFCLGSADDEETRLARASAARFEQGSRSLEQWFDAIVATRPDVLIYPEIGMDRMSVKLASLRLAPLQAASWGHPETTGLPTIDCYLSAEGLEPEGAQSNYTEELVTLPHLGCHVQAEAVHPAVRLGEFGLDRSVPLLVCPGTPFKYAPEHDAIFARIARELGQCRFLFFTHWTRQLSDQLQRRLVSAFERAGLDAARHVRVLPWLTRPAFLGLMQQADAYLDTIGFSGFNTALQAIQCGLPVVTLEGRFLRGRLASGILRRLGLHELVARDAEQYAALAVRLCRDPAYRAALSARIAASRHLLFEDVAPIRALEDFLLARTQPHWGC
jgi:predicted O-linked N-acetylglucosamine transferase (SPINDLY family)